MSNISSKLTKMRLLKKEEVEQVTGGCILQGVLLSGGGTMSDSGGGGCMLDDSGLSATGEFHGPE